MPESSYSVVVPAFNESERVGSEIKRLLTLLAEENVDYQVVVVDDGSTDGTYSQLEILQREHDVVEVVSNPDNRGKGNALKKGFASLEQETDYIIFFDADGDIKPESVVELIETEQEADILAASKWHDESEVEYPFTRTMLSRIFSVFVRIYLGLDVKDSQTGLKLVRYEVLETLVPESSLDGYAFDTEILYLGKNHGYTVLEVPVWLEFGDSSSLSFTGMLDIFLNVLKLRLR